MKLAECSLKSTTPYSQSKHYTTEKLPQEQPGAYEERTWRDRCNTNDAGHIIIPPMAFTNAVKEAAKYMNRKIPGQRNATYTKHFEAGVLVSEPLILPIKKEDVRGEWLFVPSDGRRGGGSRVEKRFPLIPAWEGVVTFYILDDLIDEAVFTEALDVAGNLIGIGRFRPRNMGYYGRFKTTQLVWTAS